MSVSIVDSHINEKSKYQKAIDDLTKLYGEPEYGGHRAVFFDNDEVIKVPTKETGEIANEQELTYGGYDENEMKFAKTKLDEKLSEHYRFLIIRMEKVTPITSLQNLPDWTGWIDSWQVGYNKNGILIAYDFEKVKK